MNEIIIWNIIIKNIDLDITIHIIIFSSHQWNYYSIYLFSDFYLSGENRF